MQLFNRHKIPVSNLKKMISLSGKFAGRLYSVSITRFVSITANKTKIKKFITFVCIIKFEIRQNNALESKKMYFYLQKIESNAYNGCKNKEIITIVCKYKTNQSYGGSKNQFIHEQSRIQRFIQTAFLSIWYVRKSHFSRHYRCKTRGSLNTAKVRNESNRGIRQKAEREREKYQREKKVLKTAR